MGEPEHLWYVSYGSNVNVSRFSVYLQGGAVPGTTQVYPGARNPSPPLESQAVTLAGTLYFAFESGVWGGGMGFWDPDADDTCLARAYLVTVEQFHDVTSQETRAPVGTSWPVEAAIRNGSSSTDGKLYDTLVHAGTLCGRPMLTFTHSRPHRLTNLNPPSPLYASTIADGLIDSHQQPPAKIWRYLASRPGADATTRAPDCR